MAKIMIKCLKTGQVVSTGMVADQTAWRKLAADWAGDAFLCPACGTMHGMDQEGCFPRCPWESINVLRQ